MDLRAPLSGTPIGTLLERCLERGVLTEEHLDSFSKESHTFSSHFQEVEQQIRVKRELSQLIMETELLRQDKDTADVTQNFYLTRKIKDLQVFTGHLQELLGEQRSLQQRLMKPLCQTSLPIEAHLHRNVVDLIQMVVDFINNLESHMTTLGTLPSLSHNMAQLNHGLAQQMTLAGGVEQLSQQVLRLRDLHHRRDPSPSR